jgi:sugar lactone lactonase YvrE
MKHFLRMGIDEERRNARNGHAGGLVVIAVVGSVAGCGGSGEPAVESPVPSSEQACRLDVVETVPVTSDADPEGITSADGRLLVSTMDGAVLAGDAADPAALEVLAPPTEARIAAGGLRAVDDDVVVVAGLRARVLDVVEAATGELLSSRPVPDDALPNDVVVHDGTVYVSDTQGDRVLAAELTDDGRLGPLEERADLSAALDRANGMTLAPDGSGLLVVGTSRGLARVDLDSGAVTAVDGGDDVSGDGLHLADGRLFTSINRYVTVLDVEADGSAVRLRGRVEVDAPAGLATLTSDGDDLLVLASGLRYVRLSPDNAVLRLDTSGCT